MKFGSGGGAASEEVNGSTAGLHHKLLQKPEQPTKAAHQSSPPQAPPGVPCQAHLDSVACHDLCWVAQDVSRQGALHRKVCNDDAVARVLAPGLKQLTRHTTLQAARAGRRAGERQEAARRVWTGAQESACLEVAHWLPTLYDCIYQACRARPLPSQPATQSCSHHP